MIRNWFVPKGVEIQQECKRCEGVRPRARSLQLYILAALSACDIPCQEFNYWVSYSAKWFIGIIRVLLG